MIYVTYFQTVYKKINYIYIYVMLYIYRDVIKQMQQRLKVQNLAILAT